MLIFTGEVKKGTELLIPVDLSSFSISNLGKADLYYSFSKSTEDGLMLAGGVGRTLALPMKVKYLKVFCYEDTFIQVDSVVGRYFLARPPIGKIGADEKEDDKGYEGNKKEIKVSPYFPLPVPSEDVDSWAIYNDGNYYKFMYFLGELRTNSYGSKESADEFYIDYRNSGFADSWSGMYENEYQARIGSDYLVIAHNKPIIHEETGDIMKHPPRFALWDDNKKAEGFYPKKYLSIPTLNFDGWILYRQNGDVLVTFYYGNLKFNGEKITSERIGYRSYKWEIGDFDSEWTDHEENYSEEFTLDIELKDIIAVSKDLYTGSSIAKKQALLRAVPTN